jgi:aryl-alcohol dehydrogenase-like predicted oxidoreductase
MDRRDFLATAVSAAAAAAGRVLVQGAEAAMPETAPSSNPASLPRRAYGRSGIQLSVIGLGGFMLANQPQEEADRLVPKAVECGVNYFDVAPTYGDAELRLGPALAPYRKRVFLACKTTQRGREGAAAELNRSLERLRTDHVDLYQLHGLTDVSKDVDVAFAKGGAMEVLIEGKKSGRIHHLGFSAHSVAAAMAAMDRYDFDSILFPVNFAAHYSHDFGRQVIERAAKKGVARLALKALARQRWPENDSARKKYRNCWYQPLTDRREAELGLRYTLSQPVTAAVSPADESLFWLAVELAMKLRPLSASDAAELKTLAARLDPIFPAA